MATNYREILRLAKLGYSQRSIAASAGCARSTVQRVLERAGSNPHTLEELLALSDKGIQQALFPASSIPSTRKPPDYERVHRELAKNGVTLSLLWNEYCEECYASKELPLMYTQFCLHYREYAQQTKATMHLDHKPGEQMEVDWAGDTAKVTDPETGSQTPAYLFIAVLSCSGYAYVEAFGDQGQESWITGHVHAYRYFGGATRILTPDNLKTGVTRHGKGEVILNPTYQEMAEHYNTCILPARVRHPKDKPTAEGTVGFVSTRVTAALRDATFFTLSDLNQAVWKKLEELNSRLFQKKPGSRKSCFEEEEKMYLLPLPDSPYEFALWKTATVQYNYHVSVEKMFYSVPCEYLKQKVEVRLTQRTVEIFCNGNRIASHIRLTGRLGQYSTVVDHMPESHRKYLQWNGERFLSWAEKVGPHTKAVIQGMLSSRKVEQQSYRACMALLKLGDKYSLTRLESACGRALQYTATPNYKTIQMILKTGSDLLKEEPETKGESYAFTRGAAYYGGGEGKC